MTDSPSRALRIANFLPVIAAGLGTTAYLRTLAEFYDWWVIVLVAPLAFFAALLVAAMLSICTQSVAERIVCGAVGAACLATGLAEADRLGTVMMGTAVLLVALCPWRQ